jgi:hypothetical protein
MIAADALMRARVNWNMWHMPCEGRKLRSTWFANRIRATRPDAYKPIHSEGAGARGCGLKEIESAARARRRRKGEYR